MWICSHHRTRWWQWLNGLVDHLQGLIVLWGWQVECNQSGIWVACCFELFVGMVEGGCFTVHATSCHTGPLWPLCMQCSLWCRNHEGRHSEGLHTPWLVCWGLGCGCALWESTKSWRGQSWSCKRAFVHLSVSEPQTGLRKCEQWFGSCPYDGTNTDHKWWLRKWWSRWVGTGHWGHGLLYAG